jgi:hypothetical protein
MNSLPPRAVIFKALDTIHKNRVRWLSNTSAEIDNVLVSFDHDNRISCSECKDFLSYHAVAVLMLKNVLPLDEKICSCMDGIDFGVINGSMVIMEENVKKHLKSKGVSDGYVDSYIDKIMRMIRESRRNGGLKAKEQDNCQSLLFSFK